MESVKFMTKNKLETVQVLEATIPTWTEYELTPSMLLALARQHGGKLTIKIGAYTCQLIVNSDKCGCYDCANYELSDY